jgi:signal transduction histidine kinase
MLYSLVMVLISIPVSFFFIENLLSEEVDEALGFRMAQFQRHIKSFENLEDIHTDILVMNRLITDMGLVSTEDLSVYNSYKTVVRFDSLENDESPFRELSTVIPIQGINYLVTIRMSLVENKELVLTLVSVQAILVVLLTIGLLLLNRSMSRKLWKPFYDTLTQLKAYELDKSEPINPQNTNIVEFDDLNKTIGHLTARNRKIFLQQKEFIENASHEMQTPLAIFQSKLDNFMQNPRLTEKEAMEILEMEQSVNRMSRLNKSLLLLSKIDNEQFADVEELELTQVAVPIVENLMPIAALDKVSIETTFHPLKIRANRTLIEILLNNLFQNAVRHNIPEGHVNIAIGDSSVLISNTGGSLTISPAEMFERFKKDSKNENSIGLGLAIIRKICDSNGYGLEYRHDSGRHIFVIAFK